MGSYDGAEVCELVGVYILSLLANRVDKDYTGLYRDDGLVIIRNLTGPQTVKTRKDIIKIFKEIGFKIEIKTNLTLSGLAFLVVRQARRGGSEAQMPKIEVNINQLKSNLA